MAENIMPAIPGECLSSSRYCMPSPETATDVIHEVQLHVGGFRCGADHVSANDASSRPDA